MNTKTERIARYFHQMEKRGFDYNTASQLRRIELTLSRWSERECGDDRGCISRDTDSDAYCTQCGHKWFGESAETDNCPKCGDVAPVRRKATGKPYWESSESNRRYPVPDREKGALRRLSAIMAGHPDYVAYHQTDPRGCALYLVAKADLNGSPIDQVYTRGLAVCY